MLGDAIRKLKLDRRLSARKGWLEEGELETALAELRDLTDQAATADETESGSAGGSPAGS
ncbi:MAG: hypothetical protein OEP95_12920 [Myxococcales bacterium]|nr:hypothetical protein [Myxococcales bacterium]